MGVIKNIRGERLLIKPQGFLDANAASEYITPLDIQKIKNNNIKYISMDFSKVIAANMNALRFLNDICKDLFKKYNVESAIFNPNNNIYLYFLQ